jgi:hypothetical protein
MRDDDNTIKLVNDNATRPSKTHEPRKQTTRKTPQSNHPFTVHEFSKKEGEDLQILQGINPCLEDSYRNGRYVQVFLKHTEENPLEGFVSRLRIITTKTQGVVTCFVTLTGDILTTSFQASDVAFISIDEG